MLLLFLILKGDTQEIAAASIKVCLEKIPVGGEKFDLFPHQIVPC